MVFNTLGVVIAIGAAALIAITYFFYTYRYIRCYHDDEVNEINGGGDV